MTLRKRQQAYHWGNRELPHRANFTALFRMKGRFLRLQILAAGEQGWEARRELAPLHVAPQGPRLWTAKS